MLKNMLRLSFPWFRIAVERRVDLLFFFFGWVAGLGIGNGDGDVRWRAGRGALCVVLNFRVLGNLKTGGEDKVIY